MQHQNPKLLQGIIITEKEEKTKATSGLFLENLSIKDVA